MSQREGSSGSGILRIPSDVPLGQSSRRISLGNPNTPSVPRTPGLLGAPRPRICSLGVPLETLIGVESPPGILIGAQRAPTRRAPTLAPARPRRGGIFDQDPSDQGSFGSRRIPQGGIRSRSPSGCLVSRRDTPSGTDERPSVATPDGFSLGKS